MTSFRRLAGLSMIAGAVVGTLAAHAVAAGEVVIFDGPAPEPAELGRILWPDTFSGAASEGVTRGLKRTDTAGTVSTADANPTAFAFLIQFSFDSSRVRSDSLPYLDSVGRMLSLPDSPRQARHYCRSRRCLRVDQLQPATVGAPRRRGQGLP